MPKVTFVNEHRIVEVDKGRLISDAAAEFGINVCRESFVGTGIGDYTVWVRGEPGSVSTPGWFEKLMGARGWKRFANRARILGDVEIWTQAGIGDRLVAPRPIAPPPEPVTDPTAARLPIDASGTSAFPYGDPRAVGKGERPPVGRSTAKPKAAKAGAAPGAEAEEEDADDTEPEPEDEDEGSDS